MNVYINQQQFLNYFDVLVAAGGKDRAYDQAFPVNVTNGQILIQFQNLTAQAAARAREKTCLARGGDGSGSPTATQRGACSAPVSTR